MGTKKFTFASNLPLLLIYEITMISLSAIIVLLSFWDLLFDFTPETAEIIHQIDLTICAVFAVDLIIHLIVAKNKMQCIKNSIITIIAIIPFSSIFRIAGILRLNNLFSMISYTPGSETFLSGLWVFFMRPAVARITKFFNMARTYFNKRYGKKD